MMRHSVVAIISPLSITGSVAGLLILAGAITNSLTRFKSSVCRTPPSVCLVLDLVEETRITLETVKYLIDSIDVLPPRRKTLVRLDHLAIVFSQCARTLSELEVLTTTPIRIWRKTKWTSDEVRVMRLLFHLENQNSSLSLMSAVLRCKSDMKALQICEDLQGSLADISEQDQDLSERLRHLKAGSVQQIEFLASSKKEAMITPHDTTIAGSRPDGNSSSPIDHARFIRHDFEGQLEDTRLYRRVRTKELDSLSLTSSALQSRFNFLSRFSLNDISITPAFRIPITSEEADHIGTDLTFLVLLSQQSIYNVVRVRPVETKVSGNLKLVIVGDEQIPKKKFLYTYTRNGEPALEGTGEDERIWLRVREKSFEVDLVDISGFERYDMQRPLLYRCSNIFLVMVEIDRQRTFEDARVRWIPEIARACPGVPYIIVGVRTSKPKPEPVKVPDSTQGLDLVMMSPAGVKYMECDIGSHLSVQNVFEEALKIAAINWEEDHQ